jgi:RNA 3'-terminal phosphate cyclase (ATP)
MIQIDGSIGEGGGQVLRTALSLSLATGQPFRIEKIRAGRAKPGLLRQHLTAVKAAAAVGRAEVDGAELGSLRLAFRPTAVAAGDYTFSVGTAGSIRGNSTRFRPRCVGRGAWFPAGGGSVRSLDRS